MKTVSKLVAAALLATASAPALASDDCDHDHGRPAAHHPASAGYVHGYGYDYDDRGRGRDHRHDGWRAQERARLRVELARLDERRAEFHARWGWHPRKVARFERWYRSERAELLRRWDALDWRYAAR